VPDDNDVRIRRQDMKTENVFS